MLSVQRCRLPKCIARRLCLTMVSGTELLQIIQAPDQLQLAFARMTAVPRGTMLDQPMKEPASPMDLVDCFLSTLVR